MKAFVWAVFGLAIGMVIPTLMIMASMPHLLVLALMILIGYLSSDHRRSD